MAEFDYSGLQDAVQVVLEDGLGDGYYITQQGEEPTSEQCPAVLIDLKRVTHRPTYIVQNGAGAQDEVTAFLSLTVYEFSAESSADAARLRDRAVKAVVDTMRAHTTVNGYLDWLRIDAVDFQSAPGNSGGIYAMGRIAISGLLRT